MNVDHAYGLSPALQWHRYFRAGIGEVGIVEKHGIRPNVKGDARAAHLSGKAHHADSQFQPVTSLEHPLAALAVGGLQDGVFALLIYKEDADMIETKVLADQMGSSRKDFV